jgi:hypothetical protein
LSLPNKKPAFAGFFSPYVERPYGRAIPASGLLDLRFLVDHVLARPGVVLFDLQFVGLSALILGCGVEVAGPGRRLELYFLAHHDLAN